MTLYEDAQRIIEESLLKVKPQEAVRKALQGKDFTGQVVLVAIGKAAYAMAEAAEEVLREKLSKGIVITKYDHAIGPLGNLEIYEAGHPVADEASVLATQRALELTEGLGEEDQVVFLVSGGGSALFELPEEGLVLEDIMTITEDLLKSGADITEMNTVRKHLSKVKGGKFAKHVGNTPIFSIVLSDVIGDPLDVIASGPAYRDLSTSEEAIRVLERYSIPVEDHVKEVLLRETPKDLQNCETVIAGSVSALCMAAAEAAEKRGYRPYLLSSTVEGEAREVGRFFGAMAREIREGNSSFETPCALIAGGETTVSIRGKGKGGRNQELALACGEEIHGLKDLLFFSLGSDGTDGPTDAAGGLVDGETKDKLQQGSMPLSCYLDENDSYHALKEVGGLLITGPTGTNVNDLMVLLVQ